MKVTFSLFGVSDFLKNYVAGSFSGLFKIFVFCMLYIEYDYQSRKKTWRNLGCIYKVSGG